MILIQTEVISMDDYGIDENYMLKVIVGVVIGLLVLFLAVPLTANIIATQTVADAASDALQTTASTESLPSTSDSILPEVSEETNAGNSGNDNSKVLPYGMTIQSGSISTGSSLSAKSVCTVFVGKEYAGADIKISTLYSRDGKNLNEGKLVEKTVDSDGYITLRAADSYSLYPDECYISIYDTDGVELDSRMVYLNIESGTQTF